MYKIIACNIFRRELEALLDKKRFNDVIFIEQGLHNTPSKLKKSIEEKIYIIENDEKSLKIYKGIILLYGLCGNGTLGLKTSKLKLIIPRVHDCMSIFLGSRKKYSEIIENNKGVYWYNHAWIDQTPMPCDKYLNDIKEYYFKYYHEDNAEYLYNLELDTLMKYSCGILIKSPLFNDDKYISFFRGACRTFGWCDKEVNGDMKIIKDLIDGKFNDKEVLVLNPNSKIALSLDENIIEELPYEGKS